MDLDLSDKWKRVESGMEQCPSDGMRILAVSVLSVEQARQASLAGMATAMSEIDAGIGGRAAIMVKQSVFVISNSWGC